MGTSFGHVQNLFLSLSFHLLLLLPSTASLSFHKPRFEPTDTSIIYEGGAAPFVGAIELNSDAYQCQVGHATYSDEMLLWDSHTQTLTDFTTRFSFTVDIQRRTIYGSGFTFFLAPVGFRIPTNSAGGFLGLYNITTMNSSSASSLYQVVHIEFDSTADPKWDPPFQHVGININSLSSVAYAPWNVTLHSTDTADVWISYNGSTKNLSLSWKFRTTAIPQEITSLSYLIDLKDVLPQRVTVGFSASTRDYIERHAVYSWEFGSSLETDELNMNNDKNMRLLLIAGLPTCVVVVVVVIAFVTWWRRNWMSRRNENTNFTNNDLEMGSGPRRFSYDDIVSATSNFSSEAKLDDGTCGATYKGYLTNLSMEVAVKKISCGSRQVKKKYFYLTEVNILSRLKHRNLVKLLGCCHEKGELLLVYEYISSGSLSHHLFGKKPPLSWGVRYRAVLESASALLYLHEEWEQCVVHGNVKSSNVMLDSKFNVKLCDFGLAGIMECRSTTDGASKEADVYGFGAVVLEIVTGRKAVDPIEENCDMSLVEWVWDLYKNGSLISAIDKKLNNEFDAKQMECLMIVGLWCANPDHSLRPSIRQAIHVLNFDAILPKLHSNYKISSRNV